MLIEYVVSVRNNTRFDSPPDGELKQLLDEIADDPVDPRELHASFAPSHFSYAFKTGEGGGGDNHDYAHSLISRNITSFRLLVEIELRRLGSRTAPRTSLDLAGTFRFRVDPETRLYDYQLAAVEHMRKYSDFWGSINCCGTGLGKTRIVARYFDSMRDKRCVICVPSGLGSQTSNEFSEATELKVLLVECTKKFPSVFPVGTTLVVNMALLKQNPNLTWCFENTDCIVFDEVHLLKDRALSRIWQAKKKHPDTLLHFMTATPYPSTEYNREDARIYSNYYQPHYIDLTPPDSYKRIFQVQKSFQVQKALGIPKQRILTLEREAPQGYWDAVVAYMDYLPDRVLAELVCIALPMVSTEARNSFELKLAATSLSLRGPVMRSLLPYLKRDDDAMTRRLYQYHMDMYYAVPCAREDESLDLSPASLRMLSSLHHRMVAAHLCPEPRSFVPPIMKPFDRMLLVLDADPSSTTRIGEFKQCEVVELKTSMSSRERAKHVQDFKQATEWNVLMSLTARGSCVACRVINLLGRNMQLLGYLDSGKVLIADKSGVVGWNLHNYCTHVLSLKFIYTPEDVSQLTGRVSRLGGHRQCTIVTSFDKNTLQELILEQTKRTRKSQFHFV